MSTSRLSELILVYLTVSLSLSLSLSLFSPAASSSLTLNNSIHNIKQDNILAKKLSQPTTLNSKADTLVLIAFNTIDDKEKIELFFEKEKTHQFKCVRTLVYICGQPSYKDLCTTRIVHVGPKK